VASDPEFERPDMAKLSQWHTALGVPLMREGRPIGAIAITRDRIEPFAERQIALVKTFADQAVIAVENARLLGELRQRTDDLSESLEYQTATSELLEVISRSAANIQPVLDTMLASAARLCAARAGTVAVRQGDVLRRLAVLGYTPEVEQALRSQPVRPGRDSVSGRVLLERQVVQIGDLAADPDFAVPELVRFDDLRTTLGVPLLRNGEPIGVITVTRNRVEPFTERQIELLGTFADQAVIAMENARLLGELTRREQELSVTFENMGDGVVMFDADLRIGAWNRNFQRIVGLSDADLAARPTYDSYLHLLADRGEFGTENVEAALAARLEDTDKELRLERTRPDGTVIETRRNAVPGGGFVLIYSDITERKQAEAEIRASRDAAEAALERQTATADILKVIASSPTDVQPVLYAVAKAAQRFCSAADAVISLREGDEFVRAAHEGSMPSVLGRSRLDRSSISGRSILDGHTIHIPDLRSLDRDELAASQTLAAQSGARAAIAAPMLREGVAVGCILLRRTSAGSFAPAQIELLEAFAAQAVIAIENVRLFTELRDSLERLKAAQANLVQSEKMASLGQLTAGIAHEIKNPLNFVNNFAGLSSELLDELKQAVEALLAEPDEEKRTELQDTMDLLTGNLAKIVEHGRRADGIVKSMLAHSRGGTGDWQASNINILVEEALNLAYHGARAQDKDFNVTLERDFDKAPGPIDVVPQDVTRVFLNLFGNGFYATRTRQREARDSAYRPTLGIATRDVGEAIEVRVRDNGTGIPEDVRAKLFQPFFTTKPTGEGTGLGLSISYDIVTQQHGGTIEVESEVGQYTEFTVRLPRARRVGSAGGA
jgi:PAS domain S-box-containing protein